MKKFVIRMPDREHADLKLYCMLFDRSMNQVIRSLIASFVADAKPKVREAMKKRGEK